MKFCHNYVWTKVMDVLAYNRAYLTTLTGLELIFISFKDLAFAKIDNPHQNGEKNLGKQKGFFATSSLSF